MKPLTPEGQQTINNLAQRYGLSVDAVMTMLQAVVNGNGTMAQFYHPELGGGGQWMQGGMTMVGDMFNYNLKSTVDNLCNELAQLLANQPFQNLPTQPQTGGNLFEAAPAGNNWWPQDLGVPNSTGAQNNTRYAYFAYARRLAVEVDGQITVYDTQDHQIGGVSQQQGYGNSMTFTSQYGTVNLSSLPIVSPSSAPIIPSSNPNPAPINEPQFNPPPVAESSPDSSADIFNTIERLAQLKEKGILTEQEFQTKKAELLARL